MARLPPAHCTKIFVQRDYSDGTAVKFQTKFPQELEGKVRLILFQSTTHTYKYINKYLNKMYNTTQHTRTYKYMN